jgi:iron complex outermembrane receptor protein
LHCQISTLLNESEIVNKAWRWFGLQNPTVFTEDAERIQFRNVLSIAISETEAEKSIGGSTT